MLELLELPALILEAGIIIVLGFANLIADGFAMSVGNYFSVKSEIASETNLTQNPNRNPLIKLPGQHFFRLLSLDLFRYWLILSTVYWRICCYEMNRLPTNFTCLVY